MTASVGISFADDASVGAESLIRNADVAMYRAKDQGRNQFVVFQENLDLQAVEQLALGTALQVTLADPAKKTVGPSANVIITTTTTRSARAGVRRRKRRP